MTALAANRSPCRTHPCSVEHADVVQSYREAVRLWDEQAEQATGGYDAEMELYREDHPRPTLKNYLMARRTPGGSPASATRRPSHRRTSAET